MPRNTLRPRLLVVIMMVLFLVTVRDASLAFFAAMINAEGTRVYSPIMLFQGAPRSHYVIDHRIALFVADAVDTLPGRLLSLGMILVFAWFWALAIQARATWRGRVIVTLVGFEVVVILATVLFSAGAAYHHVGWGMPCNWQFLDSLVIVSVFTGAIAVAWIIVGAVLGAIRRSTRSSGGW